MWLHVYEGIIILEKKYKSTYTEVIRDIWMRIFNKMALMQEVTDLYK